MEINVKLVPMDSKRRKGTKLKANKGVTIHEAGTPGAPAVNHANNQYNNKNATVNGWHFTVDDTEAWQSFPLDEVAEHSGKRAGNDSTVAIEIADKVTTGEYWSKAVDNGARLAAWILKEKGFSQAVWKENIWQHNDWSGKDCPYQIRRGNPVNWQAFVARVNEYMDGAAEPVVPQPQDPGKWSLGRVLKITSPYMRGDDVLTVQTVLGLRGYSPGSYDGIYGPATRNAVVLFQRDHELTADGAVGAKTCAALGGTWAGAAASGTSFTLFRLLKLASPMMRGEDVKAVQNALLGLGFTIGNTGPDGVYGGMTRAAVATFQRLKGLATDGIVGEKTCKALGGVWKK